MKLITHGIPQGSTLSPTFFLLYMNDIIKTVPSSTVYTYADDTTLIISAQTQHDLQRLAQSELNSLIKYFHTNNLVPNPTKTNYTVFYPRTPDQLQLTIHATTLEQRTQAPLLGITIQDNLKHTQTINIIKKLWPFIHKLKYANKLLPLHTLKDLYYTYAYPHLTSNISIWGTLDTKKTYIQPLHKIHKKIIRLIKRLPPRTHTKPIMKQLDILNIFNLYTYRVAIETHLHIYQKSQPNRPEHNHIYISIAQIHDYPTRYSQQRHHYIPAKQFHSTHQTHREKTQSDKTSPPSPSSNSDSSHSRNSPRL